MTGKGDLRCGTAVMARIRLNPSLINLRHAEERGLVLARLGFGERAWVDNFI